jgi:adenylate kinase family enzyme
MDRILIVGCCGAGKSTLAARLGQHLDLPVISLDEIYYDADGAPIDDDEFTQAQQTMVRQPRWIIDGTYEATLPIRLAEADTVIFLDVPAALGLAGILQRWWTYGSRLRTLVQARIVLPFIGYLVDRRAMRRNIRDLVAEHGPQATLHTFSSRRQSARFVARLQPVTASEA